MFDLKKLFPGTTSGVFRVEMPQQVIEFPSADAFEFACLGRTALPLERIRVLMALPKEQFEEEEKIIRLLEQRFVSMLSLPASSSDQLTRSLQDIPINNFSKDHDWRKIMLALCRADPKTCPQLRELRRIALVKYLQYLSVRREALRLIHKLKVSVGDSAGAASVQFSGAGKDSLVLPGLGEHYERLPKGEEVRLTLQEGDGLELILSRHKCKLYSDKELKFMGDRGTPEVIHPGRNAIGRDSVNDIILDSAWRDVSRLHLIVENLGNGTVRLIDMSSHGTYLPASQLGKGRDGDRAKQH